MNAQSVSMPTHPRTGLMAVGIVNGRPVWPILGGSEDKPADENKTTSEGDAADTTYAPTSDDGGDGEDQLGDKGKQALDRMKEQVKSEKADRRRMLKALDEAGVTFAKDGTVQIAAKANDGAETDADQIRAQAQKEARQELARERVMDKLEAKAAGKLGDPSDARFILLDTDADEFIDGDGNVDSDAIADAIEDLLKRKPQLAAQGGSTRGDPDAGYRNGNRPSQLDRAALKTMSPEQILVAKREGRLKKALGQS